MAILELLGSEYKPAKKDEKGKRVAEKGDKAAAGKADAKSKGGAKQGGRRKKAEAAPAEE